MGRPRKYATAEEAAQAAKASRRARYLRQRPLAPGPATVSHYAPMLEEAPALGLEELTLNPLLVPITAPVIAKADSQEDYPAGLTISPSISRSTTHSPAPDLPASPNQQAQQEEEEIEILDAPPPDTALPTSSSASSPITPPRAASTSPSEEAVEAEAKPLLEAESEAESESESEAEPEPEPDNQTGYKLAVQLRNFQGCTHEEHIAAEQDHQAHHQHPDVHPTCSRLSDITKLISGQQDGSMPLPDVLSASEFLTAYSDPVPGLDLKAAFEGVPSQNTYPSPEGVPERLLPPSLCLQQHYASSPSRRAPQERFDIDSVCCFPDSLAFARKGIQLHPKAHPAINLSADIHFSLSIQAYNSCGDIVTKQRPLHKIPHYCFGTVLGPVYSLQVFIFFPHLHLDKENATTTFLTKEDQQLWLDAILLPALLG